MINTIIKFLIAITFVVGIVSINPLNVKAQDNNSLSKQKVESEVSSYQSGKTGTLQELQSKLVDQYGIDGFRFVKSNEMKDVKNQKTLNSKELSNASGLDEYTIIIILAAIGAIAVILFIFK